MLTLGYFSKFPALFKDREKLAKLVVFKDISVDKIKDNVILITGKTDKYEQEIEILNSKITLKSECKIFCSCESFKYEFANSVFKNGSLRRPISFIKSIIKRPKHKNEHNTPSGCKHIVALIRQSLKVKIKETQV
ncbi:MAG: SWIM zinc finger family protein [Sphaerochaetaceae bacterium]|nr:SWIM zinc finger family protein [Sphaerochaetaceae bacterium]